MARTKPTEPRQGNPGFLSRLRTRKQPTTMAKVTREEKTNPITGSHTETVKRKTHPRGHGAGGHGGRGPLASGKNKSSATSGVHHRKPGIGDKISGAMKKMEGSIEKKPGKKAAGTRRMHGTDGRIEH